MKLQEFLSLSPCEKYCVDGQATIFTRKLLGVSPDLESRLESDLT